MRELAKEIAQKALETESLYNFSFPDTIFEEMSILLYRQNKDLLQDFLAKAKEKGKLRDNMGDSVLINAKGEITWKDFTFSKGLGFVFYYEGQKKFQILDMSLHAKFFEEQGKIIDKNAISILIYDTNKGMLGVFEYLRSFFYLLSVRTFE